MCLYLLPLSQDNLFLIIGTLEVMHICGVIKNSSISSINSIQLKLNIGKLYCTFMTFLVNCSDYFLQFQLHEFPHISKGATLYSKLNF